MKDIRKKRGLRQTDLAHLVGQELGRYIDRVTIGNWERGSGDRPDYYYWPNWREIQALAKVLQAKPEDLFPADVLQYAELGRQMDEIKSKYREGE